MAGHRPRRAGQRLFVALDPPRDIAEELVAWTRAQGLAGARPVRAANIHLTLAFLGERSVADIDGVVAALAAAVRGPAGRGDGPGPADGLGLGPPVLLPPRHPRVLAVEVRDPSGSLARLHGAVARELLAAIGWRDAHAFRPHLTVARIASRAAAPVADHGLAATPARSFAADALVLYRSFLEPSGARYEAIDRVVLD